MGYLTLMIGNKNYSSWSLRPWLALRHAGIPFTERLLPLWDEDWEEAIGTVSPSRRVPVLFDDGRAIWESLAILEYAHELYPEAGLWPADRDVRAVARAVASEMHAGFAALRTHMPCVGMMLHQGGSRHEWLAGQAALDLSEGQPGRSWCASGHEARTPSGTCPSPPIPAAGPCWS